MRAGQLFFLIGLLLSSQFIHAGAYLFPGSVVNMECQNESEGTVISYVRPNRDCPETSYRCNPIMDILDGETIKFEAQDRTAHLIELQGPNGVQTRYLESRSGTMYAFIWAWGSNSSKNSIWFNIDMKSCLINKASENIDLSKKTKCSFTIKEDGYYRFEYYKNGQWNGVTSMYGYSPCIKIKE